MGSKTFVGQFPEFNSQTDSFKSYVERAKLFFEANSIAEKQLAVFLSSIGGKTYDLLRSLVAPDQPKDKALEDIIAVLQEHYDPKPATIAERFQFHRRDQLPGESVTDYVAELRRLSTYCEFEGHLNDALRDRLVCGLRSEGTQKRLLAIKKLTLQEAMDLAQAMETADKNSKALQGSKDATVNRFSKTTTPRAPRRNPTARRPCHRCGKSNHEASQCRFIDAVCRKCNKVGHIAPVCYSKKKSQSAQPGHNPQPRPTGSSRTYYLETDQVSNSVDDLHLFAIEASSKSKPIRCEVTVEGVPLTMEVDTGAEVSIISKATQTSLFPGLKPRKSNVVLKTYTEQVVSVVGELSVRVQYGDQTKQLSLVVVSGNGPSLLGRNWLTEIKLNWQQLNKVTKSDLHTLFEKYKNIFKEELGTVTSHKAILKVQPEATPKFHKARPVPFAIKETVGKQLDHLEAEGILVKVNHSEWAAPIVAVPKQDGKFRICGDYKVTVNAALDIDQYPLPKPDDLFASLAGGQKFSKLDLAQAYQLFHMCSQMVVSVRLPLPLELSHQVRKIMLS